jgi:hypothetical protein
MSSAALPVEIIPGHRERHSGIGRKPFAFPPESPFTFSPESLFAFTPESFSPSPGIRSVLEKHPDRLVAAVDAAQEGGYEFMRYELPPKRKPGCLVRVDPYFSRSLRNCAPRDRP